MEWFEYRGLPTIGVIQEDNFIFMDISGIRKEIPNNNGLIIYLYRKYNDTKVKLYFSNKEEGEEIYKLLESIFINPEHNLVTISKNCNVTYSVICIIDS